MCPMISRGDNGLTPRSIAIPRHQRAAKLWPVTAWDFMINHPTQYVLKRRPVICRSSKTGTTTSRALSRHQVNEKARPEGLADRDKIWEKIIGG